MYSRTGWAQSKEFFARIEANNYFSDFYRRMKSEVEQITDTEITHCNFQEWADYLVNEYYIFPMISIDCEQNKKQNLAVMLKRTYVVEINIQLLTFISVLVNLELMNTYLVHKLYNNFWS